MRLVFLAFAISLSSSSCNGKARVATPRHVAAPLAAVATDPLWAFAPADVEAAVVVADGVLASLHGGALRVLADLERAPGGAAIAGQLRAAAAKLPVNPLDPAALAAMGLDLAKGAAVFEGPGGTVAVFPVGDARKLLARLGGSSEGGIDRLDDGVCRTLEGRYVCADTRAGLDAAAKRTRPGLLATWPKELRGHVEMFVARGKLGELPWIAASSGLRAAAVLERGGATVRLHWSGSPAGPLQAVRGAKSRLTADLAGQQPVGLLIVNAAGPWRALKGNVAAELASQPPRLGGGAAAAVVASLRGDLVAYALPGAPARGLLRLGLSDDEPARKLLSICGDPRVAVPNVVFIREGDRCTATVDLSPLGELVPGLTTLRLEQWVEPGALVTAVGDHDARSDARPGLPPFARELLHGDWLFAAWGRGAMAAGPMTALLDGRDPTGGLIGWSLHHLNELGVAVNVADDGVHAAFRIRTLWANPDEVIAAVQATMKRPAPADALARLRRVAADHPGSPFARDMQANQGGLTVEIAALGALAGVAVPSFMKYIKRSKSAAARAEVHRLYSGAREFYMDGAPGGRRFPAPSAGPTPPLGECCRQGGKCAPDPARWQAEPWRSLGFSVESADYYSYEYKVTGKPGATDGSYGVTVLARGDLDCDGVYSTLSMHAQIDGGRADGPAEVPELVVADEIE